MAKRINVVRIKAVRESSLLYETKRITSPAIAADILRTYIGEDADREHAVVMGLDTKNNVMCLNTVGIGTLNSVAVHPREIFKTLIETNCSGFIFAHNHPSGDPCPSSQDTEFSINLKQCGELMGIELMDSIVIGEETKYFSMKEHGLV